MRQVLAAAELCLAFCLVCVERGRAAGYSREPLNKGEFISTLVEDICFPRILDGAYFTFLYTSFENGANFYSGLVMHGTPERNAFNNTFWKGHMKGQVETICTGPSIYSLSTGIEGSTGGASGRFSLIQPNQWYRLVYKIWQPTPNPRAISYYGVWVKDLQTNVWQLVVISELPVLSRGFVGSGGFFEEIGRQHPVHEFRRRNSYAQISGQGWRSMSGVKVHTQKPNQNIYRGWFIRDDAANHTQIIQHAQKKGLLATTNVPFDGKAHIQYFTQPEKPTFPGYHIESAQAESYREQLRVTWQMPDSAAPHVGAHVEIADAAHPDKVVERHDAPTCYQQSMLFQTAVKDPVVTLVLRSVFDQEARYQVKTIAAAPPAAPLVEAGGSIPGLHYRYYRPKGNSDITSLEQAFQGNPASHGVTHGVDLNLNPEENIKGAFALDFDGSIDVPESGLYQFHVRGSDGYRLQIGDRRLEYDGPHGIAPKILSVPLARGSNRFSLQYFNARQGEPVFLLDWEGPGLALQPVDSKVFRCVVDAPETLTLKFQSGDASLLQAELQGARRKIKSVAYYADNRSWMEKRAEPFSLSALALGGTHDYWARAYCEDGTVWVTPRYERTSENRMPTDTAWQYRCVSHDGSPVAYQFDGTRLAIGGMGHHEINREARGDFMLKAKVTELSGEALNGYVALAVAGMKFGIFYTEKNGLCSQSFQRNFGDFPYMNNPAVTRDEPKRPAWICLARHGRTFFTYYSHDGTTWYKAYELHAPFTSKCDVGIRFACSLKAGASYQNATLDEISFEPEFDASLLPRSEPIDIQLSPASILGLTYVEGDTICARTPKGLIRSQDFGKTWSNWLGNSTEQADGIIRSLSVDPKNSKEWYCAEIDSGTCKLLYSADAGETWTALPCPGPFSDRPEHLIEGELVAVDKHTDRVVLGAASGLYLSEDKGRNWTLLGCRDQRIAFVAFNPGARPLNPDYQLFAAADPDGTAGPPPGEGTSQLLMWNLDKRKSRTLSVPAPVTDMRFQPKDLYKWFYIATRRGVYESVNGGGTWMLMYSPDAFSVRQRQRGIFDQPVTAFDMQYRMPKQNMMYAFKMRNADPATIQCVSMKGYFQVRFPKLQEGELILKLLSHPTETDKAVLGTTRDFYYTHTGGVRGQFQPAKPNPRAEANRDNTKKDPA